MQTQTTENDHLHRNAEEALAQTILLEQRVKDIKADLASIRADFEHARRFNFYAYLFGIGTGQTVTFVMFRLPADYLFVMFLSLLGVWLVFTFLLTTDSGE